MRTILLTQSRSVALFLLVLPSIYSPSTLFFGFRFYFIRLFTIPYHLTCTVELTFPLHKDTATLSLSLSSSISLSLFWCCIQKISYFHRFFSFCMPRCQMKRVYQQTRVFVFCVLYKYILFSTAVSRSPFVRTRFSFSVFRHVVVSAQNYLPNLLLHTHHCTRI